MGRNPFHETASVYRLENLTVRGKIIAVHENTVISTAIVAKIKVWCVVAIWTVQSRGSLIRYVKRESTVWTGQNDWNVVTESGNRGSIGLVIPTCSIHVESCSPIITSADSSRRLHVDRSIGCPGTTSNVVAAQGNVGSFPNPQLMRMLFGFVGLIVDAVQNI